MSDNDLKPYRGTLVGRAFYVYNRNPQVDKENGKTLYKIDLVLTDEEGKPYVITDKKSGNAINMLARAKEYSLITKEPTGDKTQIDGTYVRIKREVKPLKNGSGVTPRPETMGPTGEEFEEIIGNGSMVQVEFSVIPIKQGAYKGKSSAYLNRIVVKKHIPFISKMEEFDFGEEAPFTKPANAKKAVKPVDDLNPFEDEYID